MSVDVEEALNSILKGDAATKAIVADRVFPNRIPIQESLPAVITRRTGGGPMRTLGGTSGVKRATFQIEAWTKTSQLDARELDLTAQAAIEEFSGQKTLGDWYIQSIFIDEESDQDNPQIPIQGDDLGFFCSFCNVVIFYEAIPQ